MAETQEATRRYLPAYEAFPSRGRGRCRVCGAEVPRGRQTTCSRPCQERVVLSSRIGSQRWHVHKRDGGVCSRCGCPTEKLRRCLKQADPKVSYASWESARGWFREILEALEIPVGRWPGELWDMAHKRAVIDGGGIRPGMTVAEILGNLETLCLWCHRADTRRLRQMKAEARKLGKQPPPSVARRSARSAPRHPQ
jgi:hypothetical protein